MQNTMLKPANGESNPKLEALFTMRVIDFMMEGNDDIEESEDESEEDDDLDEETDEEESEEESEDEEI